MVERFSDFDKIQKYIGFKNGKPTHKANMFIKFLYETNTYKKFVYNFAMVDDIWSKNFHTSECDYSFLLCHAFPWKETPEGKEFWCDLETAWLDLVIDNIKNLMKIKIEERKNI